MSMRFDIGIVCPHCNKPSLLPHQSPLGIFEGLESQPTDEWPIIFLCRACGQMSERSEPDFDCVVPESRFPDLWRIECVCDHENCRRPRAIYITYGKDSHEKEVRQLLIRRALQFPCTEGHSFAVNESSIVEVRGFPVP